MKFCTNCSSILVTTQIENDLQLLCPACDLVYDLEDDDRLVFTNYAIRGDDTGAKYKNIVDNAQYDKTSYKVPVDCFACGRNYMSLVFIGDTETAIYVCKCGEKYTATQHKKMSEKQ
jgi:DNA-directed RNA polymerase subunit M/transcription elongation factor TFIIS